MVKSRWKGGYPKSILNKIAKDKAIAKAKAKKPIQISKSGVTLKKYPNRGIKAEPLGRPGKPKVWHVLDPDTNTTSKVISEIPKSGIMPKQYISNLTKSLGRLAVVLLAQENLKVTDNKYGWAKVELVDDGRIVQFNIRTKEYNQWIRGYREFYSKDTAQHLLHKWEKNYTAGKEHAVDNHLRGLIKTFAAKGDEYMVNEIYELLRTGSYTEKKAYWERFWNEIMPTLPEDFFVYE